MNERSHDELKNLVAAYVVGAVPPEEVRIVRAHILTCDECMAEADDYAAAVDSLALAVEPINPPKGFADRVMAEIAPATAEAPAPVRSRRGAWRRWLSPVAAGAAALVAVAVLGAGYVDARSDLSRSEDALAHILREEGLQLRGDAATTAELVPTSDGAVLAVAGLPEAPGSDIYQLWYMRDGEQVSVGTFESSDGVVVMELHQSFDGFEDAAVTIEPSGGSRQPTSAPVIASF